MMVTMTSWVYVVRAENGPFKVGATTHPRERTKAFQHSSPARISLEALTPGHLFLEGRIKHRWREHALWGEWFSDATLIRDDVLGLLQSGQRHVLTETEAALDSLQSVHSQAKVCGVEAREIKRWWRDGISPEAEAALAGKELPRPELKHHWPHPHFLLPINHPALSAVAAQCPLGPILKGGRSKFYPTAIPVGSRQKKAA